MSDSAPYVSIDIETTGIDNSYCQVLEIGAVIDDWVTPVEELRRFHCYVIHDQIIGEPFALSMPGNVQTLRRIAERRKPENAGFTFLKSADIAPVFVTWLESCEFDPYKTAITPAGKNFASFDRGFLKELPGFDRIKIHHRVIDPAMLFFNPTVDKAPPGTEECMRRAGIEGDVKHTAVEDAIAVIKMIRFGFEYRRLLSDIAAVGLEEVLPKLPMGDPRGPVAGTMLAYIQAHNGSSVNKPSQMKETATRLATAMHDRQRASLQHS